MQNTRQIAIEKLQAAGIRPSEPRICIYEYLWENRVHPGAEGIYKQLSPLHPTLSLTTVYNTLKLFADAGPRRLPRFSGGTHRSRLLWYLPGMQEVNAEGGRREVNAEGGRRKAE